MGRLTVPNKFIASLAFASAVAFPVAAHPASKWVVAERDEVRITSYDRSSIGHYDNNNPQHYFPKGEAIRGVLIQYKFLKTTPTPNAPKVDTREDLTLFDCESGTRVPVWVRMSYRDVPVGLRHFAPEAQLRTGFKPVIDEWNPVGSASDKIYRAVCGANINGKEDILVQ